jgi:hypothetical protein
MPGDCRCPTRPRCWTVGRNEIADAVGDVAGSCPPLLFSCAGAAGDRNQCRCSLRGCRPSPPAAVAAVVVVSSAVRRGPPPARLPGSRWQQHGLPTFSGADGRTLPCLSASRSCPCSGGCPRVAWRSTTTCCFSSTRGTGAAARQHRQQLPAASPTKKSTLEAPADLLAALPVLRRESPVAVVAVPPRRRCLPERTPAPPHLCRLPRVLEVWAERPRPTSGAGRHSD